MLIAWGVGDVVAQGAEEVVLALGLDFEAEWVVAVYVDFYVFSFAEAAHLVFMDIDE